MVMKSSKGNQLARAIKASTQKKSHSSMMNKLPASRMTGNGINYPASSSSRPNMPSGRVKTRTRKGALRVVKACRGGGTESGGVDVEFRMIQERLPCLEVSLEVVTHVALRGNRSRKYTQKSPLMQRDRHDNQ